MSARPDHPVQRRLKFCGPIRRFHRVRIMVELVTTGLLGVIRDRLWEAGRLEAIDHLDLRAWLKEHGATGGKDENDQEDRDGAIACPLIKTWYDAVVAYAEGDERKPLISAGVSVYALFRAVGTYKGAFAYQMTNEIGDSFIAPVVKALQLRGVDFQFFHRVLDVVPGKERDIVQQIVVEEQLPEDRRRKHRLFVTLEPTGEKDATLEPRKVWPNRPVFEDEQDPYECPVPSKSPSFESNLQSPGVARRVLEQGTDFHEVVFALPAAVVKDFPGLCERAGWAETCARVKAVATQSLRIWFKKSLLDHC